MSYIFVVILLSFKFFSVMDCFENPRRIRLDNEQLFPVGQFLQNNQVGDPKQAPINKDGYYCEEKSCFSTVQLG